jgi:catechol 2,3-dioxygenase-like lactoylglutathione lyase family enzyme
MPTPRFTLLYVASAEQSGAFYRALLDREPVEASPSFTLFALEGGQMLGLWGRAGVQPTPVAAPGGSELGFPVADASAVDALYVTWRDRGLPIVQPPTEMDFGRTFVATDPDGHRLRVFAVPAQPAIA